MADTKKIGAARAAIDKRKPVERRLGTAPNVAADFTVALDEFYRNELARLSAEVEDLKGRKR